MDQKRGYSLFWGHWAAGFVWHCWCAKASCRHRRQSALDACTAMVRSGCSDRLHDLHQLSLCPEVDVINRHGFAAMSPVVDTCSTALLELWLQAQPAECRGVDKERCLQKTSCIFIRFQSRALSYVVSFSYIHSTFSSYMNAVPYMFNCCKRSMLAVVPFDFSW